MRSEPGHPVLVLEPLGRGSGRVMVSQYLFLGCGHLEELQSDLLLAATVVG